MPMLKKTHTFTIDFEDEDGTVYSGVFTSKRLSIADQAKINVRKSQLCGGVYCVRDEKGNPTGLGIPEEAEIANQMIAQLEVSLVQKPDWFKLDDIYSNELIVKIWMEVMEGEKSFRGGTRAASQGGNDSGRSKADSVTERQETGSGHDVKKVVGKEIQDALDF
jgi:hypothetical protein